MKFSFSRLALTVTSVSVLILSTSPVALAQDEPESSSDGGKMVDVTALTCRDLLLMDGDDEESATLFLQGYISGKNAEVTINTDAVRVATDRSIEQCIDEPDSTILSIFEQNR
ncbi:MAG: HdeA/HdeB family chaperone [Synechococcus sp.]